MQDAQVKKLLGTVLYMSTHIRSSMMYMIVISVTLIEEHYLKSQEMTQEPEIVTEEDSCA